MKGGHSRWTKDSGAGTHRVCLHRAEFSLTVGGTTSGKWASSLFFPIRILTLNLMKFWILFCGYLENH